MDMTIPCTILHYMKTIAMFAGGIGITVWAIDKIFGKAGFGELFVNILVGVAVATGGLALLGTLSTSIQASCGAAGITL